jgi:hypothetical protein
MVLWLMMVVMFDGGGRLTGVVLTQDGGFQVVLVNRPFTPNA